MHHQDNFEKEIILSVNHSGDTDSTGAITGNILGLLLEEEVIPGR
jgi:ADP-ribosyl-[dinitrogen reductase] hydrolase